MSEQELSLEACMRELAPLFAVTRQAHEHLTAPPHVLRDERYRATLRRLLDDVCQAQTGRPVLSREVRCVLEGGEEAFSEINQVWIAQGFNSGFLKRRFPQRHMFTGLMLQDQEDAKREEEEEAAAASSAGLSSMVEVQEEPRTRPA